MLIYQAANSCGGGQEGSARGSGPAELLDCCHTAAHLVLVLKVLVLVLKVLVLVLKVLVLV